MTLDAHAFSLVVRWLHVAAMAVAVGGAALVAMLALSPSAPLGGVLLRVAAVYERAFWAAAGVLAMTGVGNLAAFGIQLPSRDTAWGTAMVAKLAIVIVLMALSVPRTLAVAQLAAQVGDAPGMRGQMLLARLYLGTVVALAVILAIAVGLAHA